MRTIDFWWRQSKVQSLVEYTVRLEPGVLQTPEETLAKRWVPAGIQLGYWCNYCGIGPSRPFCLGLPGAAKGRCGKS